MNKLYYSKKPLYYETLPKCEDIRKISNDLEQWARKDWESSGALELFAANVKVMDGDRALNKILYSEKLARINTGRLAGGILKKYHHLSYGVWWLPVLDPLKDFALDHWGCFKPIQPRTKQDGVNSKVIKYEHPPGEPNQPFFLRVTLEVWDTIANRYGLRIPVIITNQENYGYGREFWEWVIANNLPITITEGGKKTASLLCAGYVAIGLPGIYNFSRKDGDKKSWETGLNDRLQAFFKRFDCPRITIAYDSDNRLQTIKNVTNASIRLAKKLQWNVNADVKIAKWHPELGKGIDDVLVANGVSTVETILNNAVSYQTYCFLDGCKLTYPVNKINQRYLGQLSEFTQKIIGIKSPKNTGKTYALSSLCNDYSSIGKKVIVITHRIQLGSELANRLGIEFINEIESKDQWQMASLQGFVLCIDSLHPHSKAKFDLTDNFDFDDAIVIIDESEQVLNHLVNSSTLKSNRAEIVAQLEMLCERADQIYLSDADLSDYSIDCFRNLAKLSKSDIAIIQNEYQFTDLAWDVSLFSERTPDRLLLEVEKQLQQGKRILLHASSQKAKSLYSAQNILKRLTLYCQGKTLLIDSHTVADPENQEAFGIVSKLNKLQEYQLVIATPVIETGVSIEADLFDTVFCISYGVQSVHSVAQALARYRRPVPRYVWMQNRPANMMKFGGVLSSKQFHHYLIRNKKRTQKIMSDYPLGLNGLYDAYIKSTVRFNLGHQAYRENLKYLLTKDGHRCTDIEPLNITDEKIREIRDQAYSEEISAIVNSEDPSDSELETLNNAVTKTKAQRYKERKGNLIRTYGTYCSTGAKVLLAALLMPCDFVVIRMLILVSETQEVPTALVKADDDGCFKPLQLLYYMTVGKTFLKSHDSKQCEKFTSKTQTLNHEIDKSVLSVKVGVLSNLGLAGLLTGKKFNNDHPIAKMIGFDIGDDFVATFGRKLPNRLGDRINAFLELIGFKKEYVCRIGTGVDAVRHYRAVPKYKGIDYQRIFEHWLKRDTESTELLGSG